METDKTDERAIFMAALDLDNAAERQAYLDKSCQGDFELRKRVEALLHSHEQAADFLKSPLLGIEATEIRSATENLGGTIGPYKLLEQIGEGGFGIVYMADQQSPVRRRVALKIIKPGMDTRQVLARFEAERQALALMDHPNIARALDAAATDSGRPYFVMELVRGIPITDYCDQNNLAVHERLNLFVQVCHAVQHAHQKGIIHRDIKPSNVLVTMSDGRPVPKVIDFGVAKAVDRQLTQETIFTRFAEMIGTPLYMSPEQAEMTSLDIDTRSDIYSLGVLLYELLTGTTPFEKNRLKQAAFDEIRRIIREEEPAKPSTRLSTLNATSAAVAAHRHADPRRLSQLMRGDLDWIVMKALEKDRTRRYETANGLAIDIQRHLADEPVLAGPPSALYRFHKFARRNRAAFAMAAVVTVALLLGIVGTTWQAFRAMAERDRAEVARVAEAEQRQIADDARREAERQQQQADANFRKAREAVDEYFNKVSENRLLEMPGLESLRKELLESALTYYETFAEQHKDDPERQADLAVAHLRLVQIMYWNGDRATRYFPHLEMGVEILEQFVREGRDTPEVQRRFVGCWRINTEARSYERGAIVDPKLLTSCAERVPPILEKFVRDNPDVPELRDDLAGAYMYLGMNQFISRKYLECLRTATKTTDIMETLMREYPQEPKYRRDLAFIYEAKGKLFLDTGRKNLAKEEFLKSLHLREQLCREFPRVVGYRSQLGCIYGWLVDSADSSTEAEANARKAVDQYEKVAAEFPTLWACRKDLAIAYLKLADSTDQLGKHIEALKLYRQCVNILEVVVAESDVYWRDARSLSDARGKLVSLLQQNGKQQEAEAVYRQSFALFEKIVPAYPNVGHYAPLLTEACTNLNSLLVGAGRLDEAVANTRRTIAIFEKLAGDFPKNLAFQLELAKCHDELAATLRATGGLAEAEQSYRQACALKEKLIAAAPANVDYRSQSSKTYLGLGSLLREAKRLPEADEAYRNAVEFAPKNAGTLNSLAWTMATSLDPRSRNPIGAVELAKKAVELAPKAGHIWNTLGIAHYRAGDWTASIIALEKSMELSAGKAEGFNTFFLAMAQWQLGQKDEARKRYERAVAWADKNQPKDEELRRFRIEAAELIGMNKAPAPETKKDPNPAK